MILVDDRKGSAELLQPLRRVTTVVPSLIQRLEFGDIAFEGWGPGGRKMIGVERKTLHDMLHCIDDSRFTGHQMVGMRDYYWKSYLLVEGTWRPHDPDGTLMEGYNGGSWRELRYRTQRVRYSKLRRYLFSIELAGVTVLYTRDIAHTAYDIVELYHYFQKRWEDHTSLMEIQQVAIPTLKGKPSLVRKWANDIEDIGVKLSQDAERMFRTPIRLAEADERDWLRIHGIGVTTAQRIVREIHGIRG